MLIPSRRICLFVLFCCFLPFTGWAQTVDASSFCKAGGVADKESFWSGLLKSHTVTPPKEIYSLLSDREDGMELQCGLSRKSFAQTLKSCGFTKAFNYALLTENVAYCPVSDKKQPHCKQIGVLRDFLDNKIDDAGEVPLQPGTFALKLSSAYDDLDENDKRVLFLKHIAHWTSGTPSGADLICANLVVPKPFKIEIPNLVMLGENAKAVSRQAGSKRTLKDIKPMELSMAFDRENRTVTERDENGDAVKSEYNDFVSFKGAIGYDLTKFLIKSDSNELQPNLWNDSIITLYTALEYAEKFDATKETDNLSFGVLFNPQLNWNGTGLLGNPTIDFRWITDIEERESAQWKVDVFSNIEFLQTPDFLQGIMPIDWTVDGVLDYSHVINEGDKIKLADAGEAFRWGYDLDWTLDRSLFEIGDFTPTLSGSYKFRDVLGSGAGNADLVGIKLGLITIDKSKGGMGVALAYDRGENLDSLEDLEEYKITFQFKN